VRRTERSCAGGAGARIVRIDDAQHPSAGEHQDVLVHTLRRVVAWVLGLMLVASTATALGIALFPVLTGGSALAVLSGSMAPGLPVGAMAFVRPVDPATVEPGDVITFQRAPDAPELVTHRVVSVDDSSGAPVFTTKGDANEEADIDPVAATAVQGKLWFGAPHLGRLSAILHSPKGVGLLVVMVCAVIAVAPGPRPKTTDARPHGAEPDRAGTGGSAATGAAAADLVDAAEARTVVMAPIDAAAPRRTTVQSPRVRSALPPVPRPLSR
jgi:signal peptidase